jgi:DASS family divalent anion:Na+ symporter
MTSSPFAARRARGLLALVLLFIVIAYVVPVPASITPQGWRQMAIVVCVIVGMVFEPLPGTAVVLLGIAATVANGTPMREALGGFSEPSVWLVVVAILIGRAVLDSGLARRIALFFVRGFGGTSLGLSYAVQATDVTLASAIPSITARSAGMVLPVTLGITELMGSRPGPTAPRLGTFLIAAMYQCSAVACAMFFTGQASNVLGANLAMKLVDVRVTWGSWFLAAVVPGLVSCAVVPWVVYRLLTPELKRTPDAAAFAATELAKMGGLSGAERVTAAVFGGIGLLWMTSGFHALDVAFVALLGLGVLLITGVLRWEQCIGERLAWDVFVWYGGLIKMSELLNATGVTKLWAEVVGGMFPGVAWPIVLVAVLVIYFYTHYLFASITAHVLAMFPPFVVMLTAVGVPPPLAVMSLLCLANLPAGLTHYGTTTGPILFSIGYVSLRDWWRAGFVVSLVNLAVWLTVGFAWWKLLGLW